MALLYSKMGRTSAQNNFVSMTESRYSKDFLIILSTRLALVVTRVV